VAALVDRYPIANRAVRDVLVHYLVERSAVLDYGSLVNQVQVLADLFWCDLERHHPGIDSLHLPDPVVQAWKQRIRTLPDGRPRRTAHTVLFAVRSLYLDLQQWALEDPARWAEWAAPCPIREADIRGYMKETRRRRARMQERTRTLIPVLPKLVTAAEDHLAWSTQLLHTVRDVRPGQDSPSTASVIGAPAAKPATGGRRPCSSPRSTDLDHGSTPSAWKTTPSGASPPSKSYEGRAHASRSCSSSPT